MALTNQIPAGLDYTAARANQHSIPVVTSTDDITIALFVGMLIFNSTDNMLYRYDGALWMATCALGGTTSATRHEARYTQTALQTINNSTDTKVRFQTATTTTNDVTASGTGNTDFLLNRGGLWRVSAGFRYEAANGASERHIWISTGTTHVLANRVAGLAVASDDITDPPVTVCCSTDIRVTAGTSVYVGAWQNSGAALDTNVGFGGTAHVALTWLRP